MRHLITRIILGLSGLLASGIGGFILFAPHMFFAQNNILLGDDPSLLSEIRGPGGVLLVAGLIMIAGSVLKRFTYAGLITATIVFGMYGASRFIGLVLDGSPSSSLVWAMIIELVIGLYALIILTRERPHRSSYQNKMATTNF